MSQENIADASKPNAGRMYDYYLGGSHNFEVDRQAAEQVIKLLPFVTKYTRLQRWTLQDIAVELSHNRGYDIIIDFASGLPTQDHIHHKVPKGTTVIYSDYDSITVEYAHEILGHTPNVYYTEANITHPETLLNDPNVQKMLDGRRDVAFVLWGVSAFLADESLAHAVRYIYDWSGPNSCLAFNVQGGNRNDPATQQVLEIYSKFGSPLHVRTLEESLALIEPWSIDGAGFISLLEWHNIEQSELSQADINAVGPMGGGYGGYLIK